MKPIKKPVLASTNKCTGCMACADACSRNAITMQIRDDGHWYPSVNSDLCVGCGICEKICPAKSESNYGNNQGLSTPMAGWCTDKDLIRQSASGGAFAALATYVLSIGGYVVGAASIATQVKHIVINSQDELFRLQGSKYLQSDTRGIYQQVKKLLTGDHTVLFSGTGCQVAGLLHYLGKKYDKLITVDLLCAGVPSSFIMSRFCEQEKITPEHIRWRDKENGWQHGLQLTITANKLKHKWKTQNCFFWGGFLGGMTNRWSCYNCQFTGTDRQSDITIGDYWGVRDWKEQWHDGVSLLIVHSDAGKKVIERSGCLETKPTTWKDCVHGNPRIVLGKRPMRKLLLERRILPWAFAHMSYGSLQKVYAGNISKHDFLWLPYKLLKSLRYRLIKSVTKRKVESILKHL